MTKVPSIINIDKNKALHQYKINNANLKSKYRIVQTYMAALFPSGTGFEESNITISVDAS